jgi:hypothetical protein
MGMGHLHDPKVAAPHRVVQTGMGYRGKGDIQDEEKAFLSCFFP